MVIGKASFELQDLALLNKNTIITNNRDEQTIEFSEIKQRINSEKNTNE